MLIELRRFKDGIPDLLDCITDEFSNCGFPESRDFVQTALDQGRLLVLLDGLDEVPDARLDSVITAVRDFVDRHGTADDGNRFITSCRTAHYKNYFTKFTDVVLADFSDDQIREFAKNWFHTPMDPRRTRTNDFCCGYTSKPTSAPWNWPGPRFC